MVSQIVSPDQRLCSVCRSTYILEINPKFFLFLLSLPNKVPLSAYSSVLQVPNCLYCLQFPNIQSSHQVPQVPKCLKSQSDPEVLLQCLNAQLRNLTALDFSFAVSVHASQSVQHNVYSLQRNIFISLLEVSIKLKQILRWKNKRIEYTLMAF